MNEPQSKKIIIIAIIAFVALVIGLLVFYFFSSKYPSTQKAENVVIIDNYKEYTEHISPDSFGYLNNYLYEFVKDPKQSIYHAEIIEGTYTYDSQSWFSKFTVKVKDTDMSWSISMQTLKNGEINGDIGVTCETGSCKSLSERMNSTEALQDLLPITKNDFIISQSKTNYDTLSIVYYDQEGIGKSEALKEIESLGFKPDDYTIEYYYGGR